jgi:hypothetical protein
MEYNYIRSSSETESEAFGDNYNDEYNLVCSNGGELVPIDSMYPEEKIQRWYLIKFIESNDTIISICKHYKIIHLCKDCEVDKFWDSVMTKFPDLPECESFHWDVGI